MAFGEVKVYFDGSHYVGIPKYPKFKKRVEPNDEEKESCITILEEEKGKELPFPIQQEMIFNEDSEEIEFEECEEEYEYKEKKVDLKEIFERLYAENIDKKYKERNKAIYEGLKPYFEDLELLKAYVKGNLERKRNNNTVKRVRMTRKANLADFNYFCTFTYDSEKIDEKTFKKKLKRTLSNFASNRNWKYMGVWERSPIKNRLHFHALVEVPEGEMVGQLVEIRDYSFEKHDMRTSHVNSFFMEKFGRNDFEKLDDIILGSALQYLVKYIEKTGEKIVYSRGLPEYFISDILDEDVLCRMGMCDKKILLSDEFTCIDQGEIIGEVSKETIAKMRTTNE